jgi:hypothetical protein
VVVAEALLATAELGALALLAQALSMVEMALVVVEVEAVAELRYVVVELVVEWGLDLAKEVMVWVA